LVRSFGDRCVVSSMRECRQRASPRLRPTPRVTIDKTGDQGVY
jgi:hypothetical protein